MQTKWLFILNTALQISQIQICWKRGKECMGTAITSNTISIHEFLDNSYSNSDPVQSSGEFI